MKNKSVITIALITVAILSIPAIAMQFTDQVNWSPFDFIFAGILIFGTGLAYELATARIRGLAYKIGSGLALAGAFLLIWINGAVGIIGDDNPANWLYLGVIAVGIVGVVLARLKPNGMMLALFATALAQALVPIAAFIIWSPQAVSWAPGVAAVFALNAVFVVIFAVSGLLFRQASVIKQMA